MESTATHENEFIPEADCEKERNPNSSTDFLLTAINLARQELVLLKILVSFNNTENNMNPPGWYFFAKTIELGVSL